MSLPVTRQPGDSVFGCTSACIHVANNSTLCRLQRHCIEWTVGTYLTAREAETRHQIIVITIIIQWHYLFCVKLCVRAYRICLNRGPDLYLFLQSLTQPLFEASLYYICLIPTQSYFQFKVNCVCNRMACLRAGEGLPDQESYVPIFVVKERFVRGSHRYEAEWTIATLLFIFSVLIQQFSARNIVCRLITLTTLCFLATVACKNQLTQLPISTNVSIDSFLINFLSISASLTLFETQPLS